MPLRQAHFLGFHLICDEKVALIVTARPTPQNVDISFFDCLLFWYKYFWSDEEFSPLQSCGVARTIVFGDNSCLSVLAPRLPDRLTKEFHPKRETKTTHNPRTTLHLRSRPFLYQCFAQQSYNSSWRQTVKSLPCSHVKARWGGFLFHFYTLIMKPSMLRLILLWY